MRTGTDRRVNRILAGAAGTVLAFGVGACGADKTTSPNALVASVQIIATPTNPRVGQTALVSATPVNAGGVQVQGVSCTYSSSASGIAAVVQQGANAVVTGIAPGTATITATCASKSNSVVITVQPQLVTLTLTKLGTGSGSIFANPAGLSYDAGTSVTVTATAAAGSSFTGWGGACAGVGACVVVMSDNETVTATFANGETFATSAAFGGGMSSVSDPSPPGCNYNVSVSFTAMTLVITSNGATGTATSSILISGSGSSCSGLPFTEVATGNLTVSGSSITGALTHPSSSGGNDETLTINATRSGNSISGTVSITLVLKNANGQTFTSTGGPYTLAMTKQ
jgi:hypothetical protein